MPLLDRPFALDGKGLFGLHPSLSDFKGAFLGARGWGYSVRILQRYVLADLIRVFLLALAAVTTIFVMGGVVSEAAKSGFGPVQILLILPYLVPKMMPYTLPAATLFAATAVYGRLAHDNEVVALKASGVNPLQVLWPSLALGAVLSLVAFLLVDRYLPAAQLAMRRMALQEVEQILYDKLRAERVFSNNDLGYSIFVKGVEGRKLISPTFQISGQSGRGAVVARAEEASLKFDLAERVLEVEMYKGSFAQESVDVYFEKQVFQVTLPNPASMQRPGDLSLSRLWQRRREIQDEREATQKRLLIQTALALGSGQLRQSPLAATEDVGVPWLALADLGRDNKQVQREIWRYDTEIAQRWAMPLSCLFFAWVGGPVGIQFQRRDFLSAFFVCFAPIMVCYYPLMMAGVNFGRSGRANPMVVLQLGNAALAVFGFIALRRVLKR